jgi:uncharacterized membrane protein SpoIIM required for sporulation
MKQDVFIKKYQTNWDDFEAWLDYQEAGKKERKEMPLPNIDMPHYYRQLCHHLSLAKSRLYSPALIERLNDLVTRGHQQLYSSRPPFLRHVMAYLLGGFPQLVRKEWKLLALSSLLFYGPFLAMLISVQFNPELAYSVLSTEQLENMESMYEPSLNERLGRERESDSDILMFGFYIKNNTGIGFQTFAGGLLYGIGTLFFLVFNGFVIGTVAGHLTHLGYISTFWGFVSGHSAMELTAIVISGMAGLKLASGLYAPGRKTRVRALLDNGQIAVKIIYGAALMFILAAFIEAFWSSIASMPVMIKYGFGIFMWVVVISYFVFVGRSTPVIKGKQYAA